MFSNQKLREGFRYILLFAVLLGCLQALNRTGQDDLSFAQIRTLFEQEQVQSFVLYDDTLQLQLREPYKGKERIKTELYDFDLFYDELNDLVVRQKAMGILEDYDYDATHSNTTLSTLLPYLIAFGGMAFLWYTMMVRTGGMGGGQDKMARFGNASVKTLQEGQKKVTFREVAGAEEEKEELREVVDFLRCPEKYQQLGARIPKGILLVGPPGTGKTLLAKAVAGEADVTFLSISGSDFVEMYVGVGASRVRDLFEQAKKQSPAVVFIDEIDAVGRQRGTGLGGGHDEREQTLNQLLVEMDGFGDNEGVIVMAATNRADILDPALLRPGRFDRQIYVGVPDLRGREAILKVHTRSKPLAEDVDLATIAKGTSGFTGADLENLVNEAALLAARRDAKVITMEDLQASVIKVVAGPEKRSRLVPEHERRLTAFHEAGHAVVMERLPDQDPVHQITIVPRGRAGGMTISLPEEDRSYLSRHYMEDRIVSLLGGRVAEELFLSDISTGASNDIQRATQLARKMVMSYGMSERLGSINYESGSEEIFIGRSMAQTRPYSEQVAAQIDEEVKHIIGDAYARCRTLLEQDAAVVQDLAEELLRRETVDGAWLRERLKNKE